MSEDIYNSNDIRTNLESEFAKICKKDIHNFNILCEYVEKINDILINYNSEKESLEYYAKLVFERIKEHMISATILIGKGFLIDGINLVRSSFEDLWLIQNMLLKENYFEEWKEGLGVRPWKLRKLKELEDIFEENEMIYKALCNISHCSVASIHHMTSINYGMDTIIKDYNLLIVSFYSSILQVVEALISHYGEKTELTVINEELYNLGIINNLGE